MLRETPLTGIQSFSIEQSSRRRVGLNNIWIVKPAGKSRGRGIALFNSAAAVTAHVRGSNDALWVAQKYIERPLRIYGRKFDIRQWVLVTAWSPLCAWFYGKCYLRFAAGRYSTVDLSAHAHLSNNSVTKGAQAAFDGAPSGSLSITLHCRQKQTLWRSSKCSCAAHPPHTLPSYASTGSAHGQRARADDITARGNIWRARDLRAWLARHHGSDAAWEASILPGMRAAAAATLRCCQPSVKARPGSCQIFGYDFIVDERCGVWLLEVNSSPTMEYSTEITAELCAQVQEDTLKVRAELAVRVAAVLMPLAGKLAECAQAVCVRWLLARVVFPRACYRPRCRFE